MQAVVDNNKYNILLFDCNSAGSLFDNTFTFNGCMDSYRQ